MRDLRPKNTESYHPRIICHIWFSHKQKRPQMYMLNNKETKTDPCVNCVSCCLENSKLVLI